MPLNYCEWCGKELPMPAEDIRKYLDAFDGHIMCSNSCYRHFKNVEMRYTETECVQCGASIKGDRNIFVSYGEDYFCSEECKQLKLEEKQVPKYVDLVCSECGIVFHRLKAAYDQGIKRGYKNTFCSPECSNKSMGRRNKQSLPNFWS